MFVVPLLFSLGAAVLPITAVGNRFYTVNEDATKPGSEFYVVGIDYQPGGSSEFQLNGDSDVLSNADQCYRDAYAFQQLGINTIRVYAVSPWLNHDECMTILNNAGIYVILDLNNPTVSLQRSNTKDSYNAGLLNQAFGLIDAFKNYPNTLGFFSGNEIVNDEDNAQTVPPYVRAFQRDCKQYIQKHANRTIPVGYSAADDVTLRDAMFQYLNCGDDISKSDFYGLNSYEWCSGSSNWDNSGYQALNDTIQYSSIPVIFSEYGCNKNLPRTFDEVTDGVYSPDGLLYSVQGGLIYEYSEEAANYGLVKIGSDGTITYKDDFKNLKDRYSQLNLPSNQQPDSGEFQAPQCDSSLISNLSTKFDFTTDNLPDCPDKDKLENGSGNNNVGSLVDISHLTAKYNAVDADGNTNTASPTFDQKYATNWQYNVQSKTSSGSNSSSTAAASTSSSESSSSTSAAASTSAQSSSSKNGAVMVGTGLGLFGLFNLLI